MINSTQIDSLGIKLEFNSSPKQRDTLNKLRSYISSIYGLSVIHKERSIDYGLPIFEYHVYYKNVIVGVIKTGAYRPDKSLDVNVYYINIVCAGLKSYNNVIDEIKENFLFTICSWCNDKRIIFGLRELDCDIDVSCPFENLYSMMIKKAPKTKYYPNEQQMYDSTTYMQGKTKYRTMGVSALYYDKQIKENLAEPISRHELKFKFKKDEAYNLDAIYNKIVNTYERFAVFYFEDLRIKEQLISIQNSIESSNIPNKAREYKKLMPQLNIYRIYPDISYIINFLNRLLTVRNYKMIIKNDDFMNPSAHFMNVDDWMCF